MADGGTPGPGPGMSFPLKLQSEGEEFVIEMDDDMSSPPDGYGLDGSDRVRCKRRKRCGQCGPCQVKENCGKCHFCVRKDVLKQTCIYRKCVYLRSKPKPYSRPRQSPQLPATGRMSPPKVVSPVVKSPPNPAPNLNLSFQDHVLPLTEPRGHDNPFFPPHLPHQQHMPPLANSTLTSGNHMMSRGQPMPPSSAAVNMNMHMNMNHQSMLHSTPPLNKLPEPSPSLVNSPPGPLGNISGIPSITERAMNDFRHPDQMAFHPPPHFPPPVHPGSHSHPHRDSQMLGESSRLPHMNFTPRSLDNRGTNDSSCMYHPSLPYNMPGHFHQPAGPSFLSGATPNMDMFRSQFLSSFPPGYSYPPTNRFRDSFGGMTFPSLNMSSSAPFPQCGAAGPGQPFSSQYSPYNSQHGCPKNGCCPPASPSIETDAKVMQEGYSNLKRSNSDVSVNSLFWEPWRSPSWNRTRRDEVRSEASAMSSDFSCDVISIDDCQMNALIRSDGCNSIEIEFDDRSVGEELVSPRKLTPIISDRLSQDKGNTKDQPTLPQSYSTSSESRILIAGENNKVVECCKKSPEEKETLKEEHRPVKKYVKGTVCLKQDLGDEGIIQLELPGHKVSLEDTVLDDELAKTSCNLEELLEFITKRPEIEYV